jgi:hypothetical protein
LPPSIFACDGISEDDSDEKPEERKSGMGVMFHRFRRDQKDGHPHGCRGGKCAGPVILAIILVVHVFNVFKLKRALEKRDKLMGIEHPEE